MYEYYLKGEKYDLAIILRKFNLSNINCKQQFNLNYLQKKEKEHVVDRNLRFADILNTPKKYSFRLNSDKEEFIKKSYIIFVLNSGRTNKKWTLRGNKEVANFCLSKELTPILIGSPEEYEMSKEIESNGIINLILQNGFCLSLEKFYQISAGSRAVIGPDTGLIHLADASGANVIGLYGPTRPYKFAPYNNQELVVSTNDSTKLMKDVKSREVISKLEKILN